MMTHQIDNNGGGSYAWYQCKCCPYGYHIDLDFVRYCETLGRQPLERTGSIKRRRDRRRQRQSMEVLLGLMPPAATASAPPAPLTPIEDHPDSQQLQQQQQQQFINDAELNDVVRDFERTLQRSKHHNNKLSHNLPDVTAVNEIVVVRRAPSVSSISSSTSSSMTILHSSAGDGVGGGAAREFDAVSIESSSTSTCGGLSPAALQNIREQMALSLERTKELEEMVKLLPALKAQITALQEENEQLSSALRSEEESRLNRLNSNYLYHTQRSRSTSLSDAIDNGGGGRLIKPTPPPPPPRRDFGVSASVLTRNVGVGHQSPHTKNATTTTADKYIDRWYTEKSRFLNGDLNAPPLPPPPRKLQCDATTQTTAVAAAETRSSAIQTSVNHANASAQVLIKPAVAHAGVSAVVATHTRAVHADIPPAPPPPCPRCSAPKVTTATNTQQLGGESPAISLAALSLSAAPRSKSFHLGETKSRPARHRSVGVQHDPLQHTAAAHKSSQTPEVATATKHSQHEVVQVHKCVQSGQAVSPTKTKSTNTDAAPAAHTRATDTRGLAPVMKHKACEVASETADVACNTTTMKETTCAKCNNKEATVMEDAGGGSRKDDAGTPSRIPRLQIPTTPVENRTYRRQDTYTKITGAEKSPTTPPTGLTALELAAPKETTASPDATSPIEKVKQKYKLAQHQQQNGATPMAPRSPPSQPAAAYSPPTSSAIPESTLCQPSSPRKKCVPSKEMQAAMKVLNDTLQKHGGNHRGGHLKNATAIIEQEWFNISSVVNADPLDVEDYLDAYEDISGALLQHVVNMVDASGNTAMHYAVSHGNFDVVSILLDSKVCDINRQNKAGYTAVMLVSLAEVRTHTHADVVRRLFSLADVNVRAKQHGQTALMLAVSHGRLDMVRMLLVAGADINIQDEDGSTALMCAAEHGHVDIVGHFLEQLDCDTSIKDVDGSTALQIAMEAGHRHIGVLLYAHERNKQQTGSGAGVAVPVRPKKSKSASASPRMPSSPLMTRSANRALPH